MTERLPILFDLDVVAELSTIARSAAVQAGAEGAQLDEVAAGIFRVLAAHENRRSLQ